MQSPIAQCKARRMNDEMQCGQCGLTWEVKDPDWPLCPGSKDQTPGERNKGRRELRRLKALFDATANIKRAREQVREDYRGVE